MLTIGVFDGVHLGHQHLIEKLKQEAQGKGLIPGVVTFRQHPQAVLSPHSRLTLLSTLEERVNLLRSFGIELVVVVSFSAEVARLSAREFVSLLQEHLRMRGLVLGPDATLGRQREGSVPVLKALGEEMGFTVTAVSPLVIADQVVSSTLVREALSRGDVRAAARLLGRSFAVSGVVEPGERRGKRLGVPTANVTLEPTQALPADGIYATWARVADQRYKSATNVGVRPTFGGQARNVEAHLLDFHGDLYQQRLTIEFVQRLRDELRFTSEEELQAQMKRDIEQAKAILEAKAEV